MRNDNAIIYIDIFAVSLEIFEILLKNNDFFRNFLRDMVEMTFEIKSAINVNDQF